MMVESRSTEEILKERARELARERPRDEERQTVEVVVFTLGRERLALPTNRVREVFFLRHLVPVPCTPSFVAGIVNLRGTILSIVDLRPLLGIEALPEESPSAVLHLSEGTMEFGLLAGQIEESRHIFRRDISPPPPTLTERGVRYLKGVLPGPIALLNAPRLLADPEMRMEDSGGKTP